MACDLQEASSSLISFSYVAATRVGSALGLPGGLAKDPTPTEVTLALLALAELLSEVLRFYQGSLAT